ncbi:MAG: aspartate-semialdehyde dehydrogenase [Candidatus Aenigmarchaeota archaeon]|nr:aspartate-semialdehyde dehydrogenase [Candidatus Aenigmarchaeota archaeon]
MNKIPVGILGATGMVGQRFVHLLENHPWFEVAAVAASEKSAGKTYREAVAGRWTRGSIPQHVAGLTVRNVMNVDAVAREVACVFSSLDMDAHALRALEDAYAQKEIPVVSTASAHRWTPDVPMIIPEVNPEHLGIIPSQRKRLGTKRGFVVVKPNCSIQSYVPPLHALADFGPTDVSVCTYQAISGAGKTFATWPEMADNVIPFISGEEEKSEQEPLKIWGCIDGNRIVNAAGPRISAHCIRVPVSDGHLAATSVSFSTKPTADQILDSWKGFAGRPQELKLPSAPVPFLRYLTEAHHPQTRLHRDEGNGMAITIGRLREDNLFHYKFAALSHNTLRGAAGGAVLTAELLKAEGYLD